MRIHTLEVENFKKFRKQTVELNRQLTLLVGENGSGKTSLLDALAVAAAIWLVEVPDSTIAGSGPIISQRDIHLEHEKRGDRIQFRERRPVMIRVSGQIGEHSPVSWTRQVREGRKRTSNSEATTALE